MTGAISEILDEKILVLMITFVFCGGCGDILQGRNKPIPWSGYGNMKVLRMEMDQ